MLETLMRKQRTLFSATLCTTQTLHDSLTHIIIATHIYRHTHTHSLTHTNSHTLTHTLTHTHTHTHSHSHTLTHTLSVGLHKKIVSTMLSNASKITHHYEIGSEFRGYAAKMTHG